MYCKIKWWFSGFSSWLKQKIGAPVTGGYFLIDQLLLGVALKFKREETGKYLMHDHFLQVVINGKHNHLILQ
jgi:hypothetical protein